MKQLRQTISNTLKRSWFSQAPPGTAPINVIRSLFSLGLVFRHVFMISVILIDSYSQLESFGGSFMTMSDIALGVMHFNYWYAVDGFLFISGFFLASALSKIDLKKFNLAHVFSYLVKRIIRLLPMVLISNLMGFIPPNLFCVSWSEVFFFSNFTKHIAQHCVIPDWSTSLDFQHHIVIVLFVWMVKSWTVVDNVFPLIIAVESIFRGRRWFLAGGPYWPRGDSALDYVSTESEKQSFAHTYGFNQGPGRFDPTIDIGTKRAKLILSYNPFYFNSINRVAATFCGFIAFRLMYNKRSIYKFVLHRRHSSTALVLFLVAYLWSAHEFVLNHGVNEDWIFLLSFYEGSRKMIFCFCLFIIIALTCHVHPQPQIQRDKRGRGTGGTWSFLARLSYSIFLVHMVIFKILNMVTTTKESATTFTPRDVFIQGLYVTVISIVVSLPLCVIEELILMGIGNRFGLGQTGSIHSGKARLD